MTVVQKNTERLEIRYERLWKGREVKDCLWWDGRWWSWGELDGYVRDCEKKLKDAGFERGQRIAVILPNSPAVIALSVACWKLGGAIAPINSKSGRDNLIDTLRVLDPAVVFFSEESGIGSLSPEFPKLGFCEISADGPLPPFRCVKGGAESEDHAVIFSTSGTSGKPKAVPCTHSNIIANVDAVKRHVPGFLDADSVILNVLPNFHSFGFNMAGMVALISGLGQVILPSFVPVDSTIEAIKSSGANCIIGVPMIMLFLLGALAKRNERLKGIKFVMSGGDRLNVSLIQNSIEYLGVGITEGYGLTECSPVVAVGHAFDANKAGSVGHILDNYEFRITDAAGDPIGAKKEGVLWVKGPCVVEGYFRDEANTSERFKEGWFNTGDIVRIDEDGFLTIVDRATDMIIVGGFNVYPQEVENALCLHPAVRSAAVVGEKNRMTGETVKAFVILKEGRTVSQRELVEFCRKNLSHYKVPHKISFLDELPVSPAGKVLRRELRKI